MNDFQLIRPLSVTDSVLTSSNVVETAPSAYAGGTTYAINDTAYTGTIGGLLLVYTSLANGNLNHTPASSPTWWKLTGTTYAEYAGGTTYGLGAIVQVAATHKIYESLTAGNVGNAVTDTTKWLDRGATNRWKMFDGSVTSQTENPDSIVVTFVATGRVDSVALLNVSAASARVKMTDATDGVVYDQTFSLVSDSGIGDWYAYYFEPIERISDKVITGMPPYTGATIEVTLTDTGETVRCGACVIGQSKTIGGVKLGASVGIQDYSIKQRDAFGNYTILERAFNKRGSFTIWLTNEQIDSVHSLLASYRATPIVYVGAQDRGATIVYGFFKDFSIAIEYATMSVCTLELEGLT